MSERPVFIKKQDLPGGPANPYAINNAEKEPVVRKIFIFLVFEGIFCPERGNFLPYGLSRRRKAKKENGPEFYRPAGTARIVILAPQVGLEPTTLRLTAECSAIELLRKKSDPPVQPRREL